MSPPESSVQDNWDLSVEIRLANGICFSGSVDLAQLIQADRKLEVHFGTVNQSPCPIQTYFRNLNSANPGLFPFEICFQNPNAMDHPNGNWDLGADGNILLESCDLKFIPKHGLKLGDHCLHLTESENTYTAKESIVIHQASSGGEAWKSKNHINQSGKNQLPYRGYRITADGETISGNRTTPIISTLCNKSSLAVAVRDFWQNFPIKLDATQEHIRIQLLASEPNSPTELQGGEQKTFEIACQTIGKQRISALESWLTTADTPSEERRKEVYTTIPYLTERNQESDPRYELLVNLALEGSDTFFTKREMIDEYGWRHFGDVWGDHEAVYHRGESPMISHYNNQYDCTLGFAIQYLRTGDRRWWDLMIPMADHAWDIDTYHASDDKLLYNGGLFWHTYHYADAHTATHRSYPKQLHKVDAFDDGKDLESMGETGDKLTKNYQVGGGPAASHNYSTGWMLAYRLTGKERYKEAAINAAEYVLRIDDGRLTPFKWLCRSDTGYSTCSSDGYYGPGRASANSTHALLTGHELTGDTRYLDRAARLMRRTVHPSQDLDQLDLLNAELRWFYTMYLQALCRYLDYKYKLKQIDIDFRYGVASLRHYARWMVDNEQPTLSRPDQLQYPTETWAAQDMRKWHVLEHAARYESDETIRKSILNKADFFYDYVVDYLSESETKTLCRPVVLMLNFGWQREWLVKNRTSVTYSDNIDESFGKPELFVPQRAVAIQRFKKLVIASAASLASLIIFSVWQFVFR